MRTTVSHDQKYVCVDQDSCIKGMDNSHSSKRSSRAYDALCSGPKVCCPFLAPLEGFLVPRVKGWFAGVRVGRVDRFATVYVLVTWARGRSQTWP